MGAGCVRAGEAKEGAIKAPACLIAGAFTLAALVTAFWAYPRLPEIIPMRWNLRGEVNGHGPRELVFLIGPGVMLLQMAFFEVLPRIAPRRFEITPFMKTWLDLMVIMVGMTGYLFAVILYGVLQANFALERALFGGVALLFALVGNLMGRVRRNFFLGIRTPWTLASESVWDATHRVAARAMVAGGVMGLVLVLTGVSLLGVSLVLAVSLLVPILHSFFLYRAEMPANEP